LGSRSACSDERFLGRCCGLVPWSWIIVRVSKAKSGGYPKVNGPTELSWTNMSATLLRGETEPFSIFLIE